MCREEELHNMFGHTNHLRTAMMMHWDGEGPKPKPNMKKLCAICTMTKAHHRGARKVSFEFTSKRALEHVFMDCSVNMGKSIEGYQHYLCIYEGYSNKPFAYLLTTKAEADSYAVMWMKRAHNKVADGLADLTMDRRCSWDTKFPTSTGLQNANLIIQTDGGP